MIKKCLMGVGILALGTVAVIGWQPAMGYVTTSADIVKTNIEERIPFEVEVKRLEGMIDELNEVVRDHTRTCMERQVDYEILVEELAERDKQLKSQKADLLRAQDLLESQNDTFMISNKMYSRTEVNTDTVKRLEKFEADKALLQIRRQTTETLGQALKDANNQLQAMKNKRSEYAEMLQMLRANHMQLEARKQLAATVKGLNVPDMDNEFGDVSELFKRLNKRIKVENQMIDITPMKKDFAIDYSAKEVKTTPEVLSRLNVALGTKKLVEVHPSKAEVKTVSVE